MVREPDERQKGHFIRYLGELVQLRLAVENNLRDFDAPQQIIYLVDSNVVHLFLSPYSRWTKVSPFKEIFDPKREELGVATAVITAEYIFSRQLAQQKRYPAFVAAEHVEEIVEYFRHLDSRKRLGQADVATRKPSDGSGETGKTHGAPESAPERIRESLASIRQQLTRGSYDPDKLRELFGSTIPRTISLLDDQGLFPKQQFARLQREDLIRPLHLAPHIDRRRLDDHPAGEIEEWRSTLQAFVHHDAGENQSEARSGSVGAQERAVPRDHILNRDAAVLTQLFSINDDLIERKVPAKVVLITEDEKIHYAVAYRRRHQRYDGENFLRRPIQFLPALNFQEMPNLIFSSSSIDEIRSVIDSILGLKADITRDFLHDLIYRLAVELKKELQPKPEPNLPAWKAALQQAWHKTVQSSFDVNRPPHIEVGRRRVKTAWDRVSNNAVSLNVELLARRFQQELGPLADVIREIKAVDGAGGLASAFERYQVQQLDVLERQHIEWCLEWLIADPVRRKSGYVPRGPVLIRQHQLGTAEGVDLGIAIEEVMQCAAERSGDPAPLPGRILSRYGFPDLVIIAAVVAYRHGAWTQARDFAERAMDRLRKSQRERGQDEGAARYHDNIHELGYLAALCHRFELSDIVAEQYPTKRERDALRAKFALAEGAHRRALAAAEERFDFFAAARANEELGTLYLTVVAIHFIYSDLDLLRPGEASHLSVRGTEYLRRAGSDLDKHFPEEIRSPKGSGARKKAHLAADLYFAVNVNLISAVALFGLEGLYSSRVPAPLIEAALNYVRPELEKFPPHLRVAFDICDWMRLPEGGSRTRRAKEIADECDAVLRDHDGLLTRLDREALKLLRNRLMPRQQAATTLQLQR